MTNCSANVSRSHQFAMAAMASASGAAFTTRLACSRFAMSGNTSTVTDDGISDSLWDQEDGEQIASEAPSGQIVLNPRAANLQAICLAIFGGSAFASNVKLPGNICDYFQLGHSDPFVDRIFRYNNCVTSQAVFSCQEASLLNLAWSIEAQSRTVTSGVVANWPTLTLSNQPPFVFRQGTLVVGGSTFKMKQVNVTVTNTLATDFFNSLTRLEMPVVKQSFTLTHDSPWDVGTEADRIGTAQDVSATLDFTNGTKRLFLEFPKLYAIINEPEVGGASRILNSYSWRAKHSPANAITAPVRITVVAA